MRKKKIHIIGNQIQYETDYSKRCFCAVQYQKGKYKGDWSPDHIHPLVDILGQLSKRKYYCGECGKEYSIDKAIKNKSIEEIMAIGKVL